MIEVENLGKQYFRRSREGRSSYSTLRERLARSFHFNRKQSPEEEAFWALRHVNLQVQEGEVLGVIGPNGAGKSTLLKLLSRITEPTEGRFTLGGRVASLLEVGTGFHPELTGRENIFLSGAVLGMKRQEVKTHFEAIVDFAGVEDFIDMPVKRYSSGMRVRLGFAVAAHLPADILLVDEVLAVGDAAFQRKCLSKIGTLGTSGKTVLLVSHNMTAIQQLASRGILIAHGQASAYDSTEELIGDYLGQDTGSVKSYDNGVVKQIRALLDMEGRLTIELDFELSRKVRFPHLGFIVYSSSGVPIFGSNPTIDKLDVNYRQQQMGTVIAQIEYPRLAKGEYYLSIWFGDVNEDFFHDDKCVSFTISTNAGRPFHGPVIPELNYRIVD